MNLDDVAVSMIKAMLSTVVSKLEMIRVLVKCDVKEDALKEIDKLIDGLSKGVG